MGPDVVVQFAVFGTSASDSRICSFCVFVQNLGALKDQFPVSS